MCLRPTLDASSTTARTYVFTWRARASIQIISTSSKRLDRRVVVAARLDHMTVAMMTREQVSGHLLGEHKGIEKRASRQNAKDPFFELEVPVSPGNFAKPWNMASMNNPMTCTMSRMTT